MLCRVATEGLFSKVTIFWRPLEVKNGTKWLARERTFQAEGTARENTEVRREYI